MQVINKTIILLSFLGLWLTSYLNAEMQLILGLSLIFSFGILHGANDLELINQMESVRKVKFVKILAVYIFMILLSVLLFMQIPFFALMLFILVSSYHFGVQNWQKILRKCDKLISRLLQGSYGLLILSALFYFNIDETQKIINKITHVTIIESQFLLIFLAATLLYVVLSILILIRKNELLVSFIEQSFYILILCVIFKVANLILGFAIYFILWHSIPSLHDQIKFLHGSYNIENFKKYFKSAFWYWIISLFGIFILYFISKDMVIFDALFFSFLASITFPHFIVILKMYKQ